MEAKKIDLNEWEEFGAGGIGKTYFNKSDDSVILKLNNINWGKEKTEQEYICSDEVRKLGLPTPAVYEFVTDGERFGHIDERIKGKKSLARIMAEDPSQIEQKARIFARMTRELHNTPCNSEVFHDVVAAYAQGVEQVPCSEKIRQDLRECVAAMEHCKTCIHGDLQPGNLIEAGDKHYWIDLGSFGYGDPCMDLGGMYILIYILPPQLTKALFHMKIKDFEKFFKLVLRYYYDGEPSPQVMKKIEQSARLKAGMMLWKMPKVGKLLLPYLEGKMLKFKIIRFLSSFAKIELE